MRGPRKDLKYNVRDDSESESVTTGIQHALRKPFTQQNTEWIPVPTSPLGQIDVLQQTSRGKAAFSSLESLELRKS